MYSSINTFTISFKLKYNSNECAFYIVYSYKYFIKNAFFFFCYRIFDPTLCFFPFFCPDFFLLYDKNDHHTTRVYVQNSQIGIPLTPRPFYPFYTPRAIQKEKKN